MKIPNTVLRDFCYLPREEFYSDLTVIKGTVNGISLNCFLLKYFKK